MGFWTKACIWTFAILSIIPIIMIPISLVIHKPRLYIEDIYVPGLITSSTQSNVTRLNTFIFFDLKLENIMQLNGLRYGNVSLTFSYRGNRSLPIGEYTIPGFYQGHRKTAHRRAIVRTHGLPWDNAFGQVSGGSTVVFGVRLATTVKLKRCGVYMKTREMVVMADVPVDGSGEEVNNESVRFK